MKIKGLKTLPMSSAPKDGTRILIQHSPSYYSMARNWENIGKVWVEAYWKEFEHKVFGREDETGEWTYWCGKTSINSTGVINMPLGWVELEEEDLEDEN